MKKKATLTFRCNDIVVILDEGDLPYVGSKAIVLRNASLKEKSVDICIEDGPPLYNVWQSRIRHATASEKLEYQLDKSLKKGGER